MYLNGIVDEAEQRAGGGDDGAGRHRAPGTRTVVTSLDSAPMSDLAAMGINTG